MIKQTILLLSCFLLNSCIESTPPTKAKFPFTRYSKVIAYQMDDNTGALVNNGKLSPNLADGILLSQEKTNQLLLLLNDPASFNDELGLRCFHPNLGIVFFTESNLPIAHLEISFECNQIQAFPELDHQSFSVLGGQRMFELESKLKPPSE